MFISEVRPVTINAPKAVVNTCIADSLKAFAERKTFSHYVFAQKHEKGSSFKKKTSLADKQVRD